MIIDDNLAFADMITEYLSELEVTIYKIIDFEDEKDIIKKIEEIMPNLILLDINLGKASGLNVIENIKRNINLAKIPIIIITASDYNDVIRSLIRGENNIIGFCSKLEIDDIKDRVIKLFKE